MYDYSLSYQTHGNVAFIKLLQLKHLHDTSNKSILSYQKSAHLLGNNLAPRDPQTAML